MTVTQVAITIANAVFAHFNVVLHRVSLAMAMIFKLSTSPSCLLLFLPRHLPPAPTVSECLQRILSWWSYRARTMRVPSTRVMLASEGQSVVFMRQYLQWHFDSWCGFSECLRPLRFVRHNLNNMQNGRPQRPRSSQTARGILRRHTRSRTR